MQDTNEKVDVAIVTVREATPSRRWLWPALVAALLLLVSAGALLARRAASRATDLRQRHAFAVGHALAVAGLNASGASATIFEQSVRGVGFPPDSAQEMATTFRALDRRPTGPEDRGIQATRRAAFENTMLARCRTTLGDRLADHVRLGARTARLLLVLANWHLYRFELAEREAQTLYDEIRALAAKLPSAGPFYAGAAAPPAWADIGSRRTVETSLRELQRRFDMQPFRKE